MALKLNELEITEWKPFRDKKWKFGSGLTVFVGPNESGKTSIAEAIIRVLFGKGRDLRDEYGKLGFRERSSEKMRLKINDREYTEKDEPLMEGYPVRAVYMKIDDFEFDSKFSDGTIGRARKILWESEVNRILSDVDGKIGKSAGVNEKGMLSGNVKSIRKFSELYGELTVDGDVSEKMNEVKGVLRLCDEIRSVEKGIRELVGEVRRWLSDVKGLMGKAAYLEKEIKEFRDRLNEFEWKRREKGDPESLEREIKELKKKQEEIENEINSLESDLGKIEKASGEVKSAEGEETAKREIFVSKYKTFVVGAVVISLLSAVLGFVGSIFVKPPVVPIVGVVAVGGAVLWLWAKSFKKSVSAESIQKELDEVWESLSEKARDLIGSRERFEREISGLVSKFGRIIEERKSLRDNVKREVIEKEKSKVEVELSEKQMNVARETLRKRLRSFYIAEEEVETLEGNEMLELADKVLQNLTDLQNLVSGIESEVRKTDALGIFAETKEHLTYLPSVDTLSENLSSDLTGEKDRIRKFKSDLANRVSDYELRVSRAGKNWKKRCEEVREELVEFEDNFRRAVEIFNQVTAGLFLRKFFEEEKRRIDEEIIELVESSRSRVEKWTEKELEVVKSRDGKGFVLYLGGIEESKLSTGTRTQIFLAVRTAFAEKIFSKLDSDGKGFLIMDDVLLTSDRERREKIIDSIADMIKDGWQVIFFTHSEDIKKELTRKIPDSVSHELERLR